ncbi:MAG: metallophosphoesterase [Eubacteriales bacterium]|nr:metallophosphoesterase [Eubacteriales bacterium]
MSRIKVRRYQIAMRGDMPRPTRPLRIVMIGDLHNRIFGEANNELVTAIGKQVPDLVLSVGDLTVGKPGKETNLDVGLSLLKRLSCECPVYCIHGNHEFRTKCYPQTYPGVYLKLIRELHRAGIHLLEDECAKVDLLGTRLAIHGFELPMEYYRRFGTKPLTANVVREHLGEPVEGHYNILLAHNPLFFDSYALWGADLTVSGHLHGGLVRLPFLGGVISPQIQLFPKYDCGLFQKYGHKLVVTAGLGSHSFALRLNNPAEITVLELR